MTEVPPRMHINPVSVTVTKLTLFYHDILLGHATGFVFGMGQMTALVSNWHVFNGVNPLTGAIRHSTGAQPNRVEFSVTMEKRVEGGSLYEFVPMAMPLTKDGKALWWQHRGYEDDEREDSRYRRSRLDRSLQFARVRGEGL